MHNPAKTWPYSTYLDVLEFNIRLTLISVLTIHSSFLILRSCINEVVAASTSKPTHLSLVYSRE